MRTDVLLLVLICCCCLLGAAAAAPGQADPGWVQQQCHGRGCLPGLPQSGQQQQQRHAAPAARLNSSERAPGVLQAPSRRLHRHSHSVRQLQQAELSDAGNPAFAQWLQDSAASSQRFAKGSCFDDYPGFIAKDITDFVRLIKDPAATHIELKGDIVFTHEYFPPENANDQSKGINITHKVTIRACSSALQPVIVDVNNLLQQVFVYGRMSWQGSIKFINSFPSPRRGGMFPLISVLSVEGNGIIDFKGLQLHGNEPSPLFLPDDPYWTVYQNETAFAPQPDQYTRIDSQTLVMHNWTFNKRAWVLKSQGRQGVVRASGAGYWQWQEVLISWSPLPSAGAGGLRGPALALAVALPVVLGVLLLTAGALLAWWCCRRRCRGRQQKQAAADVSEEKPSQSVQPSGPSRASTTGGPPLSSCTGASITELVKTELSVTNANLATAQLIEQARRRMQETSGLRESTIMLESLLGEGTFGKVYSAMWKGSLVAVKTMLLPAAMSGKERREKMAIMETAISSSLSHPNIVQTYTYEVRPLTGELARKAMEKRPAGTAPSATSGSAFTFFDDPDGTSDHHGWELRLVLEMADLGNLKEFLGRGGFTLADGQRDIAAIIATALDIARAMLHLHTENIIHSDLKARNVLLKSAGNDTRGFVAKVSDFGLSIRVDPMETHVSNFYQGTLTHMAPEVLVHGRVSFASDVYAYGIILWEMYTARQAFKGIPRALLGHEITKLGRRPEFPPDCPFDYQLLACRCWESDPAIRPTFAQILGDLERMSSKLQGRRMDSASSLPLHPNAAAAAQQQQHQRAPGTPPGDAGPAAGHGPQAGQSVAAANGVSAAAAAGGAVGRFSGTFDTGVDANRFHNWEPQTSLLELGSTLAGDSGQDASKAGQQPPQQQQHVGQVCVPQRQQRQPNGVQPHQQLQEGASPAPSVITVGATPNSQQLGLVSLGTSDDPTEGLWMSGTLAPGTLQSAPQPGTRTQAAATASPMPLGSGQRLPSRPAGAAAEQQGPAALQQQQQQARMVGLPPLLEQQQQLLLQAPQQGQMPAHIQQQLQALQQGRQVPSHLPQDQQLMLQQYVMLRQQQGGFVWQPLVAAGAGAVTSADASSSGVWVTEGSSTLRADGITGGTGCSAATSSTDAGGGAKPNGRLPLAHSTPDALGVRP